MQFLTDFINNIGQLYSYLIGIALVIIGAGVALKAGSKWGWAILAGGIGWIFLTMRAKGLM